MYSEKWPQALEKHEPPEDVEDFKGVDGKFEKYFSMSPIQR